MESRKVPFRKCTGCQEMKNKRELLRVVKGDQGKFSLDISSKSPGRGSYICKNICCLEKAQKSKGLERSFKCFVSKDIYQDLKQEIARLTEG